MIIAQILLYKKLKAMDDLGNKIQNTIREAISEGTYSVSIQVFIEDKCYASSYEYVSWYGLKDVLYRLSDFEGITFQVVVKSYKG